MYKLSINKLFAIVMFLSSSWNGHTQTPQLAFEHFTMEQGLSSNGVFDILVDKKGYLWAATTNGLDRYDGYHFTTYKFDPLDSQSLNQNLNFSLFEDSEGFIWVGNAEGGINKFDRSSGKFTNYKPAQPQNRFEPVLRSVSVMCEDQFGMIWLGSYSGELRIFNKKTGQFSNADIDLGYRSETGDLRGFDRINCIYRDKQKNLWIGDRSGLHKLLTLTQGANGKPENARFIHFLQNPEDSNSLAGNEVTAIFEDHTGDFWILTDSALNRMDPKTGSFTHYLHIPSDAKSFDAGGQHGNMVEDHDGNLWITTRYGVDRLDKQRKHFEHFRHNADDQNSILEFNYRMVLDKAGNIWISGFSGIDKIDPQQTRISWFTQDPKNRNSLNSYSLNRNSLKDIYEDSRGILYFATYSGLNTLDRKTGRFSHFRHDPANPASLNTDLCNSVAGDNRGKIWIASDLGTLDLMDPATCRFEHYIGNKARFRNVKRSFYSLLYTDSRGLLWIGTGSNGVISYNDRTGEFKYFGHDPLDPNGISDYVTTSICEDKEGNIWVGHGSVATDRINPRTYKIKHYQYHYSDSNSISSNVVQAIFKDHDKNLWFGTLGGGFCKYYDSTDTFTSYREKDGLLDNSVNSIVEDNEGNLWLGTGKGICRFSPGTKNFTSFNYLIGLKTNKPVKFYCKGKDGFLYFAGEGMAVGAFDPKMVVPNQYIPPVVITQFKLFNELMPGFNEAKEINLNHDQNFFSFEFAALNYTYSENNQYAYKLEGVDKDWVYNGTRRTADYTSIGPGTYTFRVKGSNNEGLWNNDGTSIKIIIRPPWWKTWWAYSLYVLSFLTGVFFIDRYQRKRLIEKERNLGWEKELEMQALRAQMNPHFIFNCLSSINDFVLKNETEAASDYLTKFSRLIRTVLNNSKKSYIALEDELEMLELYLEMEKLRFNDTFTYKIDIEADLDPSSVFIPPLLFQPFVENAIWHGLMHKKDPGMLDICLKIKKNILVCIITDNGVGRTFSHASESKSAVKQKSMGIQLTRQRLALINGNSGITENDFVIEDLYDDTGHAAGTKILLRIMYREMRDEMV